MKTFGIQFTLLTLLGSSVICQAAWHNPRLRSSPYGFGFPFIAGKSALSSSHIRPTRLVLNDEKSTKCDSSKATSSACAECVRDKCNEMFQGDSSLRCGFALSVDGAGCLLSDYDASVCLDCFLEYCSEECNRDRCNGCCGQKSKLTCEVNSIGACPNIVSMCKKACPGSCLEDVCSVCNPEECSDTCYVPREEVVEVPKADPVVPPSKVTHAAAKNMEHSVVHPAKVKAPSAHHKKVRPVPAVPTPKVQAPAVPIAKVQAQDVPTPKVQAPAKSTPKVQDPAIPTPKVQAPAVPIAKVQAQDVPTTKVQAPDVSTPKVQAPAKSTPKVQDPAIPTPKVQAPAKPFPKVQVPPDDKKTKVENSGVHHITRNLGGLFGLGRR